MKKILIIQTAFIGDVILATPVVAELARIYPTAQIDFLLRKGNEVLLKNNPHIHRLLVLDKKAGKIKSLRTLLSQIRAEKYDEVINLHRFASTGILTAFSGAKSRVGFSKNPFSFAYTQKIEHVLDNRHEVERNLSCIRHHGAIEIRRPELFPSEADFLAVKPFTSTPFYCLAPASVWFTKQLPEEKWIELANKLSISGKVYLVGGPGDTDLCERIRQQSTQNVENIAGKHSLMESAALMSQAIRNYVNDSGPMHICSAMNAPVTVFFCSTIPKFGFGPLSEDALIQETPLQLDCRPCGLHGYKACPKGHFDCGKSIII